MRKLVICLTLLILPMFLSGQAVDINLVDRGVYPRIKVYVTVTDNQGETICRLPLSTFRLTERDQQRNLNVLYGEATETAIGILLDESGSMGSYINNVREAAQRFIQLLGGADRACTYGFSGGFRRFYAMVDVAVGKNKSILADSLKDYGRGGGTEMYSAISALIQAEMIKEKERRKAIVALTDGESGGSLQTALDATSKNNVTVYTIGMGAVNVQALQELAQKSGGKFYAVSAKPTTEELEKVYRDIRNRLRCQYTLIYDTPDACPDGAEVPIEVFVDQFKISKKGTYKRPDDPARIVNNLFFVPQGKPGLTVIPNSAMECEIVEFHTQVKSTSCSDTFVLKDIVVRAYDVRPGDRIEVAKSEPFELTSNGDPKPVVVKWNTKGYTGKRQIELVIDPSDKILEQIEADNLLKTTVNISRAVHDLYIQEIAYTPNPAYSCNKIDITVKVGDGCTCKGAPSHEIAIEAWDDRIVSLGSDRITVTSGALTEVKFEWHPNGRIGHIPLTFHVDPRGEFGQEQTRKNNLMQKLIEVSPALHELKLTNVTHPKKRFFVGDEIPFSVNMENGGVCAGLRMQQAVRINLKDVATNRFLTQSQPFSLETQNSLIVNTNWKTNQNDGGKKQLRFSVNDNGSIREQTPPGRENNSIEYEIEVLPMPHDLIIQSAAISPTVPVDGKPAVINLVVRDQARFPGVRLENVKVKAVEGRPGMLLGTSEPATIVSGQTIQLRFPIDTGGMAGKRQIRLLVDPDDQIEELTPEGLDGENNNEYILQVTIRE